MSPYINATFDSIRGKVDSIKGKVTDLSKANEKLESSWTAKWSQMGSDLDKIKNNITSLQISLRDANISEAEENRVSEKIFLEIKTHNQ